MDITEQITKDRENLVTNLQNMQKDYEELGRRLNQQAGALQYCDHLLERVKAQNGATPGVEAAPQDGELD